MRAIRLWAEEVDALEQGQPGGGGAAACVLYLRLGAAWRRDLLCRA